MFTLTRASGFAAAAVIALAASGSPAFAGDARVQDARAGEQSQTFRVASPHQSGLTVIGQAELDLPQSDQCSLLRRAISRHVCRLQSGMDIGAGASR